MARVKNNSLVESLSGALGNLILKQYKYGTVVSKRPDRSKVKLSKKQKESNKIFQQAVFYAKQVLKDTKLHKKYLAETKKGRSLYHVALADFIKRNKK